MKKVAYILMPTVRRLWAHIGAMNACQEFSRKGLIPKPHIIIGVSAGAAAGASCLPWTEANLKKAAEVFANLKPGKLTSLPRPTKILTVLTAATTILPLVNYGVREVLKSRASNESEGFTLDLGETLTSWMLIAALQYFFWKNQSVFSSEKMHKLFLRGLDFEGNFNSDVLFEMTATDMERGEELVFTNYRKRDKNPERFVKALLASIAIAGTLPPSQIDGRILGDGGIISRLPLHRALNHDVDAIVVFDYHSMLEEEKGPLSWSGSIIRSTEISETTATRLTLENYHLRKQLGENLPPLLQLTIKDPKERLPKISLREFTKSDATESMNIGYNAVYDNLEELRAICC